MEPDRLRPLCEHASRHDRGHVGHDRRRTFAGSNAVRHLVENPTEFSKRIARNVELLLKNESHFDQVVDPAGGSYYVENLTQSIAAEAWKLFLEIEEKGGYTEAYKAGLIVERIKASAAAKDKNIATRRQTLLGANQYPNFTEVAGKEITAESVTRKQAEGNVLVPYRGAWRSKRCACRWIAAARSPRHSC